MEFDTGGTSKSLPPGEMQRPRSDSVRLVTGHAADHRLIYELLRTTRIPPSAESFASSLEEPTYEPTDRLLVKRGTQIVAHVHVFHRSVWFQRVKFPVAGITSLATLPELRDAGYDRLLLSSAEQAVRGTAAVVAFAQAECSELLRGSGWSKIGPLRHTEANVHEILARLADSAEPKPTLGRRPPALRIRHWRHVEMEPLLEVARQAASGTWGAVDRSEPYWRWLVGRKSYDALSVAIEGSDDWDSLNAPPHIVGYAVTRGSQVIELGTLPEFPRAAHALLARACQDAVERDYRAVSLHAAPSDPLHELLLAAGGSWFSRAQGTAWLVKLLDPTRWIEGLYPLLLERAKIASFPRPLSIGFDTGRCKYRFELTRRSSHLVLDACAPSDVTCSPAVMGALMLGNLNVGEARQTDRIHFRDELAAARIAALFPQVAFWQSQLDVM